jgi:membrane protein
MRDDLRAALSAFTRRGGRLASGAIAFYSLLSFAPMLWLALRFAGLFTREEDARAALLVEVARWVGADGAATVGALVDRARVVEEGTAATALSTLLLVYASTRVFSALERAIDLMWGVEAPLADGVRAKVRRQLRKRALAFVLVLGVGAVLLLLVVEKSALAYAAGHLPEGARVSRGVESVVSFAVTVLLFFVVFRVLPHARIGVVDGVVGAGLTAALFTLGTTLVGAYLGHEGIGRKYGDAGTLVMLLLWVHYSAQIFLLGAAFTGARARRMGTLVADAPTSPG